MKVVKKPYFDEEGHFIIRPYRLKDLSEIYGVSNRTLKRWIVQMVPEIGPKNSKYYTVNEVTKIVTAIGLPKKLIPLKQAA